MDDVDPKEYCTITPFFPEKAFFFSLFLKGDLSTTFFPALPVIDNKEDLDPSITDLVDFLEKERGIEVEDEAIIAPIKFIKNFPLKREYWEGEHIEYVSDSRFREFAQLLKNPDLHKVLVLPSFHYEDNNFRLDAALPVKFTTTSKQIEKFMRHSDYVVHESANSAAIYSIEAPFTYNWQTKVSKEGIVHNLTSSLKKN